jgi:hypothetical protein
MDTVIRIGIFLVVIGVGYAAWRLLNPFIFSTIARGLGAQHVVPLPSADMRPDRDAVRAGSASEAAAAARIAVAARTAPAAGGGANGLDRQAVEAVGGDWEAAAKFNAVLAGLQARRQPAVARAGTLRARVAWKVAVFRQAALYRVVALGTGSAAAWNGGHVLGAALSARALLEAAALLADFERRVQRLAADGNLAGIDALATERAFASPLDGPAEAGRPRGVDPALIDAAFAADSNTRAHYDALADLSDAAALGQYRVFGELDKGNTEVAFSAGAGFERGVFGHVLAGFGALVPAEAALQAIDDLLPRVAALDPVAA